MQVIGVYFHSGLVSNCGHDGPRLRSDRGDLSLLHGLRRCTRVGIQPCIISIYVLFLHLHIYLFLYLLMIHCNQFHCHWCARNQACETKFWIVIHRTLYIPSFACSFMIALCLRFLIAELTCTQWTQWIMIAVIVIVVFKALTFIVENIEKFEYSLATTALVAYLSPWITALIYISRLIRISITVTRGY